MLQVPATTILYRGFLKVHLEWWQWLIRPTLLCILYMYMYLHNRYLLQKTDLPGTQEGRTQPCVLTEILQSWGQCTLKAHRRSVVPCSFWVIGQERSYWMYHPWATWVQHSLASPDHTRKTKYSNDFAVPSSRHQIHTSYRLMAMVCRLVMWLLCNNKILSASVGNMWPREKTGGYNRCLTGAWFNTL